MLELAPARKGSEHPILAGFYPLIANRGDMRIMGKRIVVENNQRYGRLVVIGAHEKPVGKPRYFICQCDCGNRKIAQLGSLRRGKTKSCGCLFKERTPEIEIGKKYNRLTAIAASERTGKDNVVSALFECSCGTVKVLSVASVMRGNTKSCGCLSIEKTREIGRATRKHGLSYSSIYRTWKAMIDRCKNPKSVAFDNYGGRGIEICKEWLDLECFSVWARSNGWKEGLSIERRDSNGNYEPSNVEFIDKVKQSRNRRNTYWWIAEGVVFSSCIEAARAYEVSDETMRRKFVGRYGKPPADGFERVPKYHESQ